MGDDHQTKLIHAIQELAHALFVGIPTRGGIELHALGVIFLDETVKDVERLVTSLWVNAYERY